MAEQTKIVNVYAQNAGSMLTSSPISGNVLNVRLTIPQIRECLFAKAKVEEVVNGKTIPLNLSNYMMDNPEEELNVVSSVKQASKTSGKTLSVDKFGKIVQTTAPAASNNKEAFKTTIVANESTKKEKSKEKTESKN